MLSVLNLLTLSTISVDSCLAFFRRAEIQTNCNFNKEHTYYQGHYLYRIAYRPAVL